MLMLLALLLQSVSVSPDPREQINVESEYGDDDGRSQDRDLMPAQERRMAAARASFEQSSRQLAAEFNMTMDAMAKADHSWAKGSPEYSKKLSASQESWAAYRNAHCRIANAPSSGGKLVKMQTVWSCLDTLNRERAKQLIGLRPSRGV